jgi:predicted Rossmann fold nucleotide-binding protein DprA/Smf involved in DNA uptake
MNINKLTLKSTGFPEVLRNIPHPPKVLYHAGAPLNDLFEIGGKVRSLGANQWALY